jgi:hypothetical protein
MYFAKNFNENSMDIIERISSLLLILGSVYTSYSETLGEYMKEKELFDKENKKNKTSGGGKFKERKIKVVVFNMNFDDAINQILIVLESVKKTPSKIEKDIIKNSFFSSNPSPKYFVNTLISVQYYLILFLSIIVDVYIAKTDSENGNLFFFFFLFYFILFIY